MPRARVLQGTSRIWAFLTAYLPRECASRLAYISDHLTIEFLLFHSIIAPLKGSPCGKERDLDSGRPYLVHWYEVNTLIYFARIRIFNNIVFRKNKNKIINSNYYIYS